MDSLTFATNRRAKNEIKILIDGNGGLCDSQDKMRSCMVNYFTDLFYSSQPSTSPWDDVIAAVPCKLMQQKRDFLDLPFSAAEVKKAVFDMFPTKAPGLDGMPALFYQKLWDSIGGTITAACLRCLNEGDSLEVVNRTLVTLIPKKPQAKRMSEFRPISLCNVSYKIVAKTLANKFRMVLEEVISESQSAFVPGRLISDNAVIGFE